MGQENWFSDTSTRATTWRDEDIDEVRQGDIAQEIADDPTSITIKRASGAGNDPGAQTVRLLDLSQRPSERMTIGGDVVQISLMVLGQHNLNIERDDKFKVGSDWYEVVEVRPAQDNKVVAECRLVT